ncbi:MAG: patatin [Bacteroidetes bacterium]|nr:MAG: patatin [Bacteroidota bacterium]
MALRYGIALGGGGSRGFAHLGVMQALHEKGIKPEVFSGTSAGALAAVLLGSGKEPQEVFEVMHKHKMIDFAELDMPGKGLFSLSKLKKTLEKEIEFKNLEDLPFKVFVCATDLLKGEASYFDKGPISTLVQASASIPVLFSPVKYEKGFYVDGGVLDNVPFKPLKGLVDKIIAVNINPIEVRDKLGTMVDVATRSFQLGVNSTLNLSRHRVDYFIEPEGLHRYFMLDTSKAEEIFKLGYESASKLEFE